MAFTPNDRQELWRLLLLGQGRLRQKFAAQLKADFDLTSAQFEALVVLQESDGHTLTMSGLAHRVLYSSGSTTNLVKRLEERSLVRRHGAAGDGRSVSVTLTETGADLITRARSQHSEDLQEAFEPLVPDEELETLLTFARRLAQRRPRA